MALGPQRDFLKRGVFFGPAFVAAIGYIDPGNYATNIQAGAQYGPMLLPLEGQLLRQAEHCGWAMSTRGLGSSRGVRWRQMT